MKRATRALAAATILTVIGARPTLAAPCTSNLGPKAAAELVRQCREVSLALRPVCGPAADCGTLRAEIRHGCEEAGPSGPSFCEAERDDDDEEEDG